MKKLNKHVNYKDATRILIRQDFKLTYTKSVRKNTVVIQIQMWP